MMKTRLCLFVLCFVFALPSTNCLRCYDGAVAKASIFDLNNVKITECADPGDYCLRGSVSASLITFPAQVEASLCANATMCNQSCTYLANMLVRLGAMEFLSPDLFQLLGLDKHIQITSCKRSCCSSDLCNFIEQKVEEEEEEGLKQSATATTPGAGGGSGTLRSPPAVLPFIVTLLLLLFWV